MRRLSWPCGGGGLGGLTMSEDGGLEEVEESLRAAASCWPSWATTSLRAASSASRASTRAWSRRQLVQRAVSLALMGRGYTDPATMGLQRGTGTKDWDEQCCSYIQAVRLSSLLHSPPLPRPEPCPHHAAQRACASLDA